MKLEVLLSRALLSRALLSRALLSRALCGSLAFLPMFTACGGSPDAGEGAAFEDEPLVAEMVAGKLLTQVDVGPEHTVEFYELEGGGIAIGERLSMDAPESERLDLEALGARGPQHMFRTLAGDERAEVPLKLIDAEARRAQSMKPQDLLANAEKLAHQLPVIEQATGTLAPREVAEHADSDIQSVR